MRTDVVTGENFRQVRRKYSDKFLESLAKEGKNVEWWLLEQMSLPLDKRAPVLWLSASGGEGHSMVPMYRTWLVWCLYREFNWNLFRPVVIHELNNLLLGGFVVSKRF